MQLHKKEKNKLPYEKPRLRTIELAADEVLAIGCKIQAGYPGKSSEIGCGTAQCVLKPGS